MFKPRIVVAAILVALILILVVQNSEVVPLRALFWEFRISRVILILLASLTGFVCGYLVARIAERRGAAGRRAG